MNQIDEMGRTCAPAKERDFGLRCTRSTSFRWLTTMTLAERLGVEGTLDAIVVDDKLLREIGAEVSPASVRRNRDVVKLAMREHGTEGGI